MSQYNYKPAPRYLGKKVTAKLKIGPGNDELLRDAPRLVSIGLEKGWIHPPKDRPMTDAQIHTFRLKNAKVDGAAQLHADQA